MSTISQRKARIDRPYPLALETCMRELLKKRGLHVTEADHARVRESTVAMLALGAYPEEAVVELSEQIPIDSMSDEELLRWLVEDLRDDMPLMLRSLLAVERAS